jgi:hypothetical protein
LAAVLCGFAFSRIGVVVSDLYFVDANPGPGQEGPEQGVRLELRMFELGEPPGSVYSARPVTIGRPIWRVDLLESVANPGSLDRAHHHPRFRGWEPGRRHFVDELSADPLGWVGKRLSDLPDLLHETGSEDDVLADAEDLRQAVPEILAAVQRLLDRVRASGVGATLEAGSGRRASWL